MRFLLGWLILLAATLGATDAETDNGKVVTCYFESYVDYYEVKDLKKAPCSHLILAFAILDNSTHLIALYDENDGDKYTAFTGLKNTGLKTLLAIGGMTDSKDKTKGSDNNKYSDLVASKTKREKFVKHVITFLEYYKFDGLDLDWEFPKERGDKDNFAKLVKELKTAFKPKKLMLTAAVGVGGNDFYDFKTLCKELDYVHLMTYDLRGWWGNSTTADHHSPLCKRSTDTKDNEKFNTDYIVNYWIKQGCAKTKLVVGVPMYGRSFTLTSKDKHEPTSLACEAGKAGTKTDEAGLLSYSEICEIYKNNKETKTWTFVKGTDARGPYAYSDNQWVGYDDKIMAAKKAKYVKKEGLGGVLVWAVNYADIEENCGDSDGKYPLLSAMYKELRGANKDVIETKNYC